jgi:hypothetical protein
MVRQVERNEVLAPWDRLTYLAFLWTDYLSCIYTIEMSWETGFLTPSFMWLVF